MTTSNSANPGKNRKKWIIENLVSLGSALLIVLFIRSSVVEPYKIPSGSMIPTLLVGDHIFVNKFAYGLKLPFSDSLGGEPIQLIKRDPPKRGDIIVFLFPKDERQNYIKRVIGVPGDRISIINKQLVINGERVPQERVEGPEFEKVLLDLDDNRYVTSNLELYTEKLPGQPHPVLIDRSNVIKENQWAIEVPADHLFVMGDNRDASSDSRAWGFVPMKNVKGKAMFIWLSLWLSLNESEVTFRPRRIGTVLH